MALRRDITHESDASHPVAGEEAARHGYHAGDPDGGVQERGVVAHARYRHALGVLDAHLPSEELA